jgi:hypothetical protein
VLLSIGLLGIALLALLGQSALLAKSNQKTDDNAIALDLANTLLERTAKGATADQPPGTNASVSDWNSAVDPYSAGTEVVGFTEYDFQVFITDVPNALTGSTLGTGTSGVESDEVRLKRFRVHVIWWDSDTQQRSELGKLQVDSSRLVKVTRADS